MKNLYYLFLLLVFVSCGPKAPTDEQLKELCRNVAYAIQDARDAAGKDKAFQEVVDKTKEIFDVNKITSTQIKLIFETGGISLNNQFRSWLAPVLEARAHQEGKEGVEASFLRWKYFPVNGENRNISLTEAEACRAFMQHPAMIEFLSVNGEALIDVVNKMSTLKGDKWGEYGILEKVNLILDITLPEEAVMASREVFNSAFVADHISNVEKNEIRQKVLKQYMTLSQSGKVTDKKKIRRVEAACAYLQGAYATRTLVGGVAPELDFLWTSRGNEKKLSDCKGRVVMLDFWATKCGACVAIFPNVKALTKYYAGYPVEILGVTSLQGYHVDIKNKKNITTTGKPELEFELMQTFMKDMDMTWKVVFTQQPVMNPDYGALLGIPHITLIDANGNVRYNGENAEELPYLKAEKINALLKEAGLPYPSKPMEQKDYRTNQNWE